MNGRAIDIVARFAQAWDCRGEVVLFPPFEHAALATLAGLAPRSDWHNRYWDQLTPQERLKLLHAARRVIEVARACAWAFGEE